MADPASPPMPPPLLVMVGGPNGSGKTTLIESLRAARDVVLPAHYVNADDLRADRRVDARAAQRLAGELRRAAIAERRSLLYETVMSHPSKIAELQLAARAGYTIVVVFVATGDPAINVERVRLRVAAGGHPVAEERIRARHRRSIALAPAAIACADHAYVYDNSGWGGGPGQPLQAVLGQGRLATVVRSPAPWVADLLRRVNARAEELEALWRDAPAGVGLPDLDGSVAEGPVRQAGRHYALQLDQASARLLLHDRSLLAQPVLRGRSYRIAYHEGVASLSTRRSAVVKPVPR